MNLLKITFFVVVVNDISVFVSLDQDIRNCLSNLCLSIFPMLSQPSPVLNNILLPITVQKEKRMEKKYP